MLRYLVLLATAINTTSIDTAYAQKPTAQEVVDRIQKYEQYFQPADSRTTEQAKAQLAKALESLDALLVQTNAKNRQRWNQYLYRKRLASEMSSAKPNVLVLQAISKQYYVGNQGLSINQFLVVREALDTYIDRLLAAAESPRDAYQQRVAALAALFAPGARRPTSDELGEHVAWLNSTGQGRGLVSWLQRKYSQPNMVIYVSSDLLSEALSQFEQEIDQTTMMTRHVAGVAVSGLTHTKAKLTANFVPNKNGAALQLQLKGIASSPLNAATQGPVSVYSSGTCNLFATKQLFWTDKGIVAGPTRANCQTQAQLTGVDVDRFRLLGGFSEGGFVDQFIGNIAMNKASEMQAQAEADANRLANSELTEELDSQVSKQLVNLNGQVDEYYRLPLTRLGMLPSLRTAMTDNSVRIDLTRPGPANMAAPARPNYQPQPGTFSFSFHESALAGFLTRFARGGTWTDTFMADLQKQLIGDNDYELRLGPHPRWSVRLDWTRPVSARFSPEGIELEMRMRQVNIAGKAYHHGFIVRSRYKVYPTRTAPRFERQGDIDFVWLDEGPILSDERAMLTDFLTRKFSAFFPEECHTDGLSAPAGGQWGNLSDMRVIKMLLEPGWMTAVLGAPNSKPKGQQTALTSN